MIDLQNYGNQNKGLIYLTSSTILILDLPTSLFLTFLIVIAVTKYKAKGPSLWLLIALNVGIFSFASVNVFFLIAIRQYLDSSPENLVTAYQTLLKSGTAYAACNLITEMCSDVVYWIFAMKYWTLAC